MRISTIPEDVKIENSPPNKEKTVEEEGSLVPACLLLVLRLSPRGVTTRQTSHQTIEAGTTLGTPAKPNQNL